jgi:hypothetical protein
MKVTLRKIKREYFVTCTKCGATIRQRANEDSSGICLGCFYKFLNERLAQKKGTPGKDFASER